MRDIVVNSTSSIATMNAYFPMVVELSNKTTCIAVSNSFAVKGSYTT